MTANSPEFRNNDCCGGSAFSERNARHIARLRERGLADADIDPTAAAQALSGMVSRNGLSGFRASATALISISWYSPQPVLGQRYRRHRPDAPTG